MTSYEAQPLHTHSANRFLQGSTARLFFAFCTFLALATFGGCVRQDPYVGVAPGIWRGVLYPEGKTEERMKTSTAQSVQQLEPNVELPFLFEVKYDSPERFHIEIINGTERVRVDSIIWGRTRRNEVRDTIRMVFPIYGTHISAQYEDHLMEGWLYLPAKKTRIKFEAKYGQPYRFTQLKQKPLTRIDDARWQVVFGTDKPEAERETAIGEFHQDPADLTHLTGTFLPETGDYRYLAGTLQGDPAHHCDRLALSCFDGTHAYLFTARINPDGTAEGVQWSGNHHKAIWTAKRDPAAKLRDLTTLTTLQTTSSELPFSFPSIDGGKMVSPADLNTPTKKVKVVQILGTWCPNCLDETRFLTEYAKQNPELAIIGIGYERTHSRREALDLLRNYRQQLHVPYTLVAGGYASRDSAAASLPAIKSLMAFPTTVVIDKQNHVRRIYTGFTGPATSEYEAYKKEFDAFVRSLQKE